MKKEEAQTILRLIKEHGIIEVLQQNSFNTLEDATFTRLKNDILDTKDALMRYLRLS